MDEIDFSQFEIAILAAGRGTRMNSSLPKPLILLNGKPIIQYLLDTIYKVNHDIPISVVVSSKDIDTFRKYFHSYTKINYIIQETPLGTGDAYKSFLYSDRTVRKNVLVLLADHPFISVRTIKNLVASHLKMGSNVSMLTASVPNFRNIYKYFYMDGRIIRDSHGNIESIKEPSEITKDQMDEKLEINPSIYVFDSIWSKRAINEIRIDPIKREYYLTHLIKIAFDQKQEIGGFTVDALETFGINTPEQLATAKVIQSDHLIQNE